MYLVLRGGGLITELKVSDPFSRQPSFVPKCPCYSCLPVGAGGPRRSSNGLSGFSLTLTFFLFKTSGGKIEIEICLNLDPGKEKLFYHYLQIKFNAILDILYRYGSEFYF